MGKESLVLTHKPTNPQRIPTLQHYRAFGLFQLIVQIFLKHLLYDVLLPSAVPDQHQAADKVGEAGERSLFSLTSCWRHILEDKNNDNKFIFIYFHNYVDLGPEFILLAFNDQGNNSKYNRYTCLYYIILLLMLQRSNQKLFRCKYQCTECILTLVS